MSLLLGQLNNGQSSTSGSMNSANSGQSTPAGNSALAHLAQLGQPLNAVAGASSSSSGSNSTSQTPNALDLANGFSFPSLGQLGGSGASSSGGTPVPTSNGARDSQLSASGGSPLSPDTLSNALSSMMNNALGSLGANPISSSLSAGLSMSSNLSNGLGSSLGNNLSSGLNNTLSGSNGLSGLSGTLGGNGLLSSLSLSNTLGGSTNGSSLSSTFVKCGICGLSYTEPKVLPCCLRSYCLGCLEELNQQQASSGQSFGILKCPACAHELQLPEQGAAGLLTDASLVRWAQQSTDPGTSPPEPTCTLHRDQPLRFYCRTCEQPTCKECTNQHLRHKHEHLKDASKRFVRNKRKVLTLKLY